VIFAEGRSPTSRCSRQGHFAEIPFIVQLIPLLLMVGAFGKSAQLPLYVWLPDAMEGPTPVSALIHAATMVTAGVYLIARTYPLFLCSEYALPIVAWVGTLTALLAATIGMAQFDIKRIMAYSTVSQLGYMFAGLGVLTSTSARVPRLTHAFFKALLFLCCGAVMHGFAGSSTSASSRACVEDEGVGDRRSACSWAASTSRASRSRGLLQQGHDPRRSVRDAGHGADRLDPALHRRPHRVLHLPRLLPRVRRAGQHYRAGR
jgi:hypothetical protein